jgi:PAS domain S-box-containing protein
MKENEERLRLVSELSSDYAYCYKLNEDGAAEPVWHIGSFDKITGYTPEELYKKGGWSALIHPEDIPGAASYIETLLRGKRASFTTRIVAKDGSFRFIHDSGRPWVDPDTGRVIGTMGSARDITALKQNEQELKAIYENAPILMLLVDRDRRVRKVNAFAGEFAGSPAEKLLGQRTGEALRCVHHLDDPRGCGFSEACKTCSIRLMIESSFENGRRFYKAEAVLPVSEGDGEKDILFLVSTALLHQNGEELCLVCFEDLTGGN